MKKGRSNSERPFSRNGYFGLANSRCAGLLVLNKIKLFSMTVAGIEVELFHLSIRLVIVPVIVIEAVNRTHDSGAVPSARAVHIELAGFWIVCDLQKLVCLFRAGVCFINDGNVNVTHSSSLNCRLLALPGIVRQVNDGLDTEGRQALKVFRTRPG